MDEQVSREHDATTTSRFGWYPDRDPGLSPPPEILVVDDDEIVCRMVRAALQQHGFAVRLATTGRDAVELYRQHKDRISVVLLDVQMPGLDGPHTLMALREVYPPVRCVFMSGNPGQYSEQQLLALGADRVLPKPFPSLTELAEVLREATRGPG